MRGLLVPGFCPNMKMQSTLSKSSKRTVPFPTLALQWEDILVAPPARWEWQCMQCASHGPPNRRQYLIVDGGEFRPLPEAARILGADMIRVVSHVDAKIMEHLREQ